MSLNLGYLEHGLIKGLAVETEISAESVYSGPRVWFSRTVSWQLNFIGLLAMPKALVSRKIDGIVLAFFSFEKLVI